MLPDLDQKYCCVYQPCFSELQSVNSKYCQIQVTYASASEGKTSAGLEQVQGAVWGQLFTVCQCSQVRQHCLWLQRPGAFSWLVLFSLSKNYWSKYTQIRVFPVRRNRARRPSMFEISTASCVPDTAAKGAGRQQKGCCCCAPLHQRKCSQAPALLRSSVTLCASQLTEI